MVDKEASIVDVVQHKQPSILARAQPVVHQLKDVRLWVVPASELDAVGDVAEALLEPGSAAGVRPQYPSLWRRIMRAISMLDGKLRLASR
jgi:hypothetical protein